jgi:hypothetical protein
MIDEIMQEIEMRYGKIVCDSRLKRWAIAHPTW